MRQTHRLDQFETGNAGRARAVDDDLDVLDVAARQKKCVDEAGGGDDGGAVLVVVKDRNVHHLAQAAFDDEAVRR